MAGERHGRGMLCVNTPLLYTPLAGHDTEDGRTFAADLINAFPLILRINKSLKRAGVYKGDKICSV
jgi:hypothetical protein